MSGGLAGRLAAGVAGLIVLVVVAAGAGLGASSGLSAGPAPGGAAAGRIPATYLALYQEGAATCPGLSWTVLAAIGTVESDNGQSAAAGVHTGANYAGAQGPMQFEPATFAAYATPVPPGGAIPASPYDPVDAIYAAARDLCANGGLNNRDLPGAVFAYNHSHAYVTQVMALAATYANTGAAPAQPAGPAATAVAYAVAQIGTPYRWGGSGPGGFDCSGLVQAAYAAAGVRLPRVAQAQYDAGPSLPSGTPALPGDLVFFGTSPTDVTHVGLVVAPGEMIDAPHTGAVVRTEAYPTATDDRWGADTVLGSTRPAH